MVPPQEGTSPESLFFPSDALRGDGGLPTLRLAIPQAWPRPPVLSEFPNPLDGLKGAAPPWVHKVAGGSEEEVGMMYLAAVGEKGNEAFLGIGVIGWIIIIVLVAAAIWFVRGRRA